MSFTPAPIALTQSSVFEQALSPLGLEGQRETLRLNGQDVGHALVLSRKVPMLGRIRALVRGPVWSADLSAPARLEALHGLGVSLPHLIEADAPDPIFRGAGYRMVMTPGATGWLDIGAGDTARDMPRAHPKWRANLARARNAGFRTIAGPFGGARGQWLLTQEAALRKSRGYRSVAGPISRALAAGAPDALCLISAETRGPTPETLAAMLFVRHGQSATYLIGATTDAGRAACAHHLLLAEAAERLSREGVRWIDLGQIDTEANPGLARFKLGTGAELHSLGGSWLCLPIVARARFTGKAGSPMVEPLKR